MSAKSRRSWSGPGCSHLPTACRPTPPNPVRLRSWQSPAGRSPPRPRSAPRSSSPPSSSRSSSCWRPLRRRRPRCRRSARGSWWRSPSRRARGAGRLRSGGSASGRRRTGCGCRPGCCRRGGGATPSGRGGGGAGEFRLGSAPDGLRLSAGLLQTRAETIPFGRVQAVRWVQPLLWRRLGWVRLEVDLARLHGRDRAARETAATTRALLPVGTAAEAARLLALVLPGASVTLPPQRLAADRAPRRALVRAPFSQHYLRAWHDEHYMVCGSGRIRPSFVVVPLHKAQSIRWSQGPVQRRLNLADVFVDSAGVHFPGRARMRNAAQAKQWAAELPDLARAARSTYG